MKRLFMTLAVLTATLTLSGCLTASLITNADFTTPERQVTTSIGEDKVFLFGKITLPDEKNGKPSKNEHLLMLGEKYAYVIDTKKSTELLAILQSDLSGRYSLGETGRRSLNHIPLYTTENNPSNFWTNLILEYTIEETLPESAKKHEMAELERLGFTRTDSKKINYQRKLKTINVKIYQPQNITLPKDAKKFEQHVPVILYSLQTAPKTTNGGQIAKVAVLAPLALAADAVLTPVAALICIPANCLKFRY